LYVAASRDARLVHEILQCDTVQSERLQLPCVCAITRRLCVTKRVTQQ